MGNLNCCSAEESTEPQNMKENRTFHKSLTFVKESKRTDKKSRFADKNYTSPIKKECYNSDNCSTNSILTASILESQTKTEDNAAVRTYFAKLSQNKTKKSNFSRRTSIIQSIHLKKELSNLEL